MSLQARMKNVLAGLPRARDWLQGHLMGANGPATRSPGRTLRLAPAPTATALQWWAVQLDGAPAMSIHCELRATNVSRQPVRLSDARMERPRANVLHPALTGHGEEEIAPGDTLNVTFTFIVAPPIRASREVLDADLVFMDQSGTPHRLKGLQFKYMGTRRPGGAS